MRKRNNIKKEVAHPDTVAEDFEKRYGASMQASLNEVKAVNNTSAIIQNSKLDLGYRKNHQLKQKTKRHINKLLELPSTERNHLLNAICQQFGLTQINQTTLNL
jgi:hypothetical protein